jgi:hypothetical protein
LVNIFYRTEIKLKDITLSFATELLTANGFILAYEDNHTDTNSCIHKIYLNIANNILLQITGSTDDSRFMTQAYFAWRPKNYDHFKSVLQKAEALHYAELVKFIPSGDCFDSEAIGFSDSQSPLFLQIWQYYLLVSKNGIFLPWKPETNLSILNKDEIATIIKNNASGDSKDSKNSLSNEIDFRSANRSKLVSILRSLNLPLTNFGLR